MGLPLEGWVCHKPAILAVKLNQTVKLGTADVLAYLCQLITESTGDRRGSEIGVSLNAGVYGFSGCPILRIVQSMDPFHFWCLLR